MIRKILFRKTKIVKRFLINNISKYIYAATPYAFSYLLYTTYQDRGYFAIGGEFLLPIIPLGIAAFIDEIRREQTIDDLPIPPKRFTKKHNGNVVINVNDLFEVTEYLCELEDEIEKRGLN